MPASELLAGDATRSPISDVNDFAMVEVHVDFPSIERYAEGKPSVRFKPDDVDTTMCKFHDRAVCKCNLPLSHQGQDEAVFHAYLSPKRVWKVEHFVTMRKKGNGPGRMTSGYMCDDEGKGMGLFLDEGQLAIVNEFRALQLDRPAADRAPLLTSPGLEYLDVGKNRDGWWNYECLAAQVTKVMDVCSALFPKEQILFEVDWSSGHSKYPPDTLHAQSMNRGFGGGQTAPRDTTVQVVGDFPSIYCYQDSTGATVEVDVGLQPGMIQSFTHKESDPPPFYTKYFLQVS